MESVGEIFHWDSLHDLLKLVLPPGYTYLIKSFDELPSYQTSENYSIPQFELKTFVDVNDKERVHEWFQAFESHSKTTMAQTKGYSIKGKKVLVREKRHCIHSNEVKKKQGDRETKHTQSSRTRNIHCSASIDLRLENWRKKHSERLLIDC